MERLTLASGGLALNSFDDLNLMVWDMQDSSMSIHWEKFTYIEKYNNPHSVKGPNKHTHPKIKDS